VGFNYRLTNLQAAIAYAQFEKLEKLVDSRILVNKSYREMLSGIEGISFQHEKEYAKNIYWMTGILVNQEKTGFSRNQLEEHLAKNDIQTRRFFVGMNRQPVFQKKNIQVVGEFPISDMLSDNGLYLPSSSQLRDSDIERITQTIKELL
jgi:perosamine synthetase